MENPATNSTTPGNPTYLWMEEPNQRGTFGIVTLCISTLIISVWNTVHFGIPTKRRTPTRRFFTQVIWMVVALLAPEFLLYLAINECTNAAHLQKKTLVFHPRLAKRGMLTRMYHYIRGLARPTDERHDPIVEQSSPTFGFAHAFYAIMGGFAFILGHNDKTSTVDGTFCTLPVQIDTDYYVPGPRMLMYIMKHFPHLIANVPEETILERAQSDSISKALLIVQVGWFCANCVSRLIQRLPLSLLEVSTAAHALCTLLTYFIWWTKPLNVPEPIILRGKDAREVYTLLSLKHEEYNEALEMARRMAAGDPSVPIEGKENITLASNALLRILQRDGTPEEPPIDYIDKRGRGSYPGSFTNKYRKGQTLEWTITAVSPILYGLVHLLAWNDHFPTPLERRLWRVSSVVVTSSGLVGVSLLLVDGCLERFVQGYKGSAFGTLFILSTSFLTPIVHALASGFLVVESFRQLFFLDPAAYQLPPWPNYWPHLS